MKATDKQITEFLESKRNYWTRSTITTVGSKLKSLRNFGADPAIIYERMLKQGFSKYSIKQYFIVAKPLDPRFGQFLKEQSYLFRFAYQNKLKALSIESFHKALEQAPNIDVKNALVLMGRGGLRWQECLDVKWSDFSSSGDELSVTGKGGRTRTIPFSRSWLAGAPSELSAGPEAKVVACPSHQLRAALKYPLLPLGFGPHDLRSMRLTELAQNRTLTIQDIKAFAGHSDIRTTERYLRADFNRLKGAIL